MIDAAKAHSLHMQGMSWRAIGQWLASAEDRRVVYHPSSVYVAVRRYLLDKKRHTGIGADSST